MQFRLRLSLRQLLIQMARRPDLLCGAIVLSCTLILSVKFAYSRAKNVVSPARPPVRFFSPSAPIIDLYLGQLDQVQRLKSNSDVTLIYFYAPWCGESVSARVTIEQVAKKLSDQVQFIAINCWWNQGKCRKQKNFYYYPVIYVYYRRFGPIEYTGPFTAAYLERFVRRVIAPLVYIPSEERLKKFLSHYEPGVLGYFEFNTSPQPPGYLTFLMSALQALKRDFQGVLRFGVITSRQLANRISLTSHGTVFMHRHFNTSLIFPRDALNFTSENICKWAYENLELFYRWLRPHGGKSRLMDKELKKGAALLVFLPFDPLAESQPQIDEVADVALQYHNCNRIPTLSLSLEAMGIMTSPEYSAFQSSRFLCCNTVVIPQWHSVSRKHNVCELCINHSLSIQPTKLEAGHCQFQEMGAALDSFYLREHTFTRFMSPNVECSNIHDLHNPFRYYSACCKTLNTSLANNKAFLHPSAIWRHGYIPFSQVKDAHKDPQNIVPHIEDDIYLPFRTTSVTGLKCITNKTLHFYLLDSYLHWTFAVRLGASENDTMKKFVTIVNLPEEIHHVLDQKEAIKKNPLEAFIHNYSVPYSPLKRHLVGDTNSETLRDTLIKEVTTKTFNDTVMDPEKDVLLFYYTQWCGFCSVLNHVLIQLAHFFQFNKMVTVSRINAAKNDLPWEYMVDRFPTILFFPSDRKHSSVKFPDAPINLPNLVRFVIRYSSRRSSTEVQGQAAPNPPIKAGSLQAQMLHLENEVNKLRREVLTLQLAKDQLSRQLSEVRQEKRQLTIHAHTLEKRNTELQLQGNKLEKLYEQKKQELDDTVEKLQELADASENLLTENTLLKILMASMKEERKAALTETSSSSDEHLLEKSASQREEL